MPFTIHKCIKRFSYSLLAFINNRLKSPKDAFAFSCFHCILLPQLASSGFRPSNVTDILHWNTKNTEYYWIKNKWVGG